MSFKMDYYVMSQVMCLSSRDVTDCRPAFETAYVLKYVERNDRPNNPPWSIRRMAVYQNFNQATMSSDSILIRSSERAKKRIHDLAMDGSIASLPTHWTFLHELHLGTLSHNWQELIQYKEAEFSKTVRHRETSFNLKIPRSHIPRISTISPKSAKTDKYGQLSTIYRH
jgi:hypothetical protein